MQKLSPKQQPPHILSNPRWLHGIDRFIERVSQIADAHAKRVSKSARKQLAKTA
jgi:hypothetical protein